MRYACLLLFLLGPQITAAHYLSGALLPPKWINVTVRVDFGPAGKSELKKEVLVKDRSTPKEALKQVISVEEGKACCHPAEVKGIGGVSVDPLENRWWRLKINGTGKNASPHKSHLRAGDLVEWVYFEDLQ